MSNYIDEFVSGCRPVLQEQCPGADVVVEPIRDGYSVTACMGGIRCGVPYKVSSRDGLDFRGSGERCGQWMARWVRVHCVAMTALDEHFVFPGFVREIAPKQFAQVVSDVLTKLIQRTGRSGDDAVEFMREIGATYIWHLSDEDIEKYRRRPTE